MTVFDEDPDSLTVGLTRVACTSDDGQVRYGTWYGFPQMWTTGGQPAAARAVRVWKDGDPQVSYHNGHSVEVLR